MLKLHRIAVLALSITVASGASATGQNGAEYGVAVAHDAAERTITVAPTSRWINVVNGETVTFVVDGKRFSWHVSTYPYVGQFALQKIAPADVQTGAVQVIVAPNPLYYGG
jgi:hypothetical protein